MFQSDDVRQAELFQSVERTNSVGTRILEDIRIPELIPQRVGLLESFNNASNFSRSLTFLVSSYKPGTVVLTHPQRGLFK